MITSLQIRNFKGWSDTGSLRLAPITVFFGTNSSGKSSLGQFLMMLKQTASSPDRGQVLHPGDGSTAVDLGTMEDLIHLHDPSKELRFDLRWRLSPCLEVRDAIADTSFKGSELEFGATIGFDTARGTHAQCRRFSYKFVGEGTRISAPEWCRIRGNPVASSWIRRGLKWSGRLGVHGHCRTH